MDGLNVYLYVGNDPINGYDPEGLKIAYEETATATEVEGFKRMERAIEGSSESGKAFLAKLRNMDQTVTFARGKVDVEGQRAQTIPSRDKNGERVIHGDNYDVTVPLRDSTIVFNEDMFAEDLDGAIQAYVHEIVHAYDFATGASYQPGVKGDFAFLNPPKTPGQDYFDPSDVKDRATGKSLTVNSKGGWDPRSEFRATRGAAQFIKEGKASARAGIKAAQEFAPSSVYPQKTYNGVPLPEFLESDYPDLMNKLIYER